MHQKIGRHLINLGLAGLLVFLLALPSWVGGYLILQPEIKGRVAGSQVSLEFELYPNLLEFGDYVSFQPQKVRPGLIKDQLSLTYFPGQIATYHQVYQIYNPNPTPLWFRLVWDGSATNLPPSSKVMVILQLPEAPVLTRLARPAPVGSTLITLENPAVLSQLARKLATTDRILSVLNVSSNLVVTTPLKEELVEATEVYPEPILAEAEHVTWPQTQWVRLDQQAKTVVTAVVLGHQSPIQPRAVQTLSLPILFEASFAPAPAE